jgi:hypothetical protein
MKTTTLLILAVAPLAASGSYHDHNWKLDEKESILRSFDGADRLIVDNVHGFVHVTGYAGSKVEVAIEQHIYADSAERVAEAKRDVKMVFSQDGGAVRCREDGPFRNGAGMHYGGDDEYGYRVVFDFEVQVPYATALTLKTVNQGDIHVRKVAGDYDIHGLNGPIEMEEISGAGVVSTLNGGVKVAFARNPTKPSQFKTLNGTVDVRFQNGLDADLHFKKLNGAIYTDFDVAPLPVAAHGHEENGMFVYRSDRMTAVRAGKGGPDLSFETLNGTIRLHNKAL